MRISIVFSRMVEDMPSYKRLIDLPSLLSKKSFFLFGPRATGKSTLIDTQLKGHHVIDLLDSVVFREYLRYPERLREIKHRGIIVIDEVQKLTGLLDEVHRLIQKHGVTFLLTGSSARKLKKQGSNLLAGRAWWAELFPLVMNEIPEFSLITYLNRGGLPAIYPSDDHREELKAYTSLYLREEVMQEALTRKIDAFAHCLELFALSNGEEINHQSFASDVAVSPNTIKNFIDILKDTLLAFELKGFSKTKKRKAVSRSKLYFFDVGVVNQLAHQGVILEKSSAFGKAFEHFILQEVRAYLSYARKDFPMHYWRSESKFEVDLILGNAWAIEIKSTSHVDRKKHFKGIRALKEEQMIQNYAIVSLDREPRQTQDGIHVFPWKSFLEKLWNGHIV